MCCCVSELQWVENALSWLLARGISTPSMIDVGAHHGTSFEIFLRAGWRVFAFEPMEHNRRRLEERFADNPTLTLFSEAVSDCSGTRLLQLALDMENGLHDFHHSLEDIGADAWHRKGPRIEVATASLDDLASDGRIPRRVGYLKVDTEGHDLAVLRGAASLECEAISVEFWNDAHAFGPSPSPAPEMLGLLRERGFDRYFAIVHRLDQTEVLVSTLNQANPDSWGNLIALHRSRADLFEQIVGDEMWKSIVEQARVVNGLNAQLREKEEGIQEIAKTARGLSAQLEEKEETVQRFIRLASEQVRLIERLTCELEESKTREAKGMTGYLAAAFKCLRQRFTNAPRTTIGGPRRDKAA